MKRTILLISFLLVVIQLKAQIKSTKPNFFAGVEVMNNKIKVFDPTSQNSIIYDNGEISVVYGIRYSPIKSINLELKTETSMNMNSLISYTPVNSSYTASGTVKLNKKISMKIEHNCIHPIKTDGIETTQKFGGYTKAGIYFNY